MIFLQLLPLELKAPEMYDSESQFAQKRVRNGGEELIRICLIAENMLSLLKSFNLERWRKSDDVPVRIQAV